MQIMTAKTTSMRTLYVHVVLNGVIFRQISTNFILFYMLNTFCLSNFSLSITLKNYA